LPRHITAPPISKPVLWFFRRIVRGYFQRHFHAVRISGTERSSTLCDVAVPLLLYANHGSWWDPMVAIFLAESLMPGRQHYAPMDAEALTRYPILKHVGIFPVEKNSRRGAIEFLRNGEAIVHSGAGLWITPQGSFVDCRVRPLEFKPGLARLAVRVADRAGCCHVQPLAIEYTFWDERLPECLLHVGEPVLVTAGEHPGEVERRLLQALERCMDTLQDLAVQRDASLFDTMTRGAAGPGGFYSFGQRIKSALSGTPRPAEAAEPESSRKC
jgi:1-acyl-sn-glycerol-3-phosphate acyltransferase